MCVGCQKIPSCEAPKTRLLQFGPDLNVLPVAPPSPERMETAAMPTEPTSVAGSSKKLCPAAPRRYYDDSYVTFASLIGLLHVLAGQLLVFIYLCLVAQL